MICMEISWLLSYEANIKGWLPPVGPSDNVEEDPCFNFFKKQKVTFYNNSLTFDHIITRPLPPIADDKTGGVGGIY